MKSDELCLVYLQWWETNHLSQFNQFLLPFPCDFYFHNLDNYVCICIATSPRFLEYMLTFTMASLRMADVADEPLLSVLE